MSRQLEPASGTKARAPTDEASSLASASRRGGSAILDFQKAYGNRQVARWVLSRQPTATPLADTATYDNRDLAKTIDEIRKDLVGRGFNASNSSVPTFRSAFRNALSVLNKHGKITGLTINY